MNFRILLKITSNRSAEVFLLQLLHQDKYNSHLEVHNNNKVLNINLYLIHNNLDLIITWYN